jgi:hypothetical protein
MAILLCRRRSLWQRLKGISQTLQDSFGNLSPTHMTNPHIFDHTIVPIILYGCGIWSPLRINQKRLIKTHVLDWKNILIPWGLTN